MHQSGDALSDAPLSRAGVGSQPYCRTKYPYGKRKPPPTLDRRTAVVVRRRALPTGES